MSSSLKINKIIIENINSFRGRHELSYSGGFTLIKGFNFVNQSSNGTGKSTIIDAIVYALFGRSLKKELNIDDLVNTNSKDGIYIELHMSDSSGNEYVICRSRAKKNSKFSIAKNGTCITENMTATEAQSCLESMLGLSYQTFVNNNVLNTELFKFIKSSSSEKLSILERVLGLDVLSKLYNIFVKSEKSDNESYQNKNKECYALETSLKNLILQKESFNKNILENISTFETKNIELSEKIEELSTQSKILSGLLTTQTKEASLITEKISSLNQKIGALNVSLGIHKKDRLFYESSEVCKSCNQPLPNREHKLKEAIDEIERLHAEVAELTCLKETLTTEKIFSELKETELNVKTNTSNLNNMIYQLKSNKQQIEKLKGMKEDTTNIDQIKDEIRKAKSETDDAQKTLEESTYWRDFVAPKSSSRTKIASNLLKILNININKTIDNFFTEDLKLHFEIKGGNIEESIVVNGHDRKYESLSSGERQKLDIIVVLSLLEIGVKHFKNNNLRLLVCDECSDHLDAYYARYMVEYMKEFSSKLGITTLFISHHSIIDDVTHLFDDIITVCKDKNGSRIMEKRIAGEVLIDDEIREEIH